MNPIRPDMPLTCDLCLATPAGLWIYSYGGFEMLVIDRRRGRVRVRAEAGRWGVCDECAALTEARDLAGMVRRAVEKIPGVSPGLTEAVYAVILEKRIGSPVYCVTRSMMTGSGA